MDGNNNQSNSTRENNITPSCPIDSETDTIKVNQDREEETVYEGIRGHERHILSHFFTLFCISFVGGLVLIHLSLWLNVTCGVNITGQKTSIEAPEPTLNTTEPIVQEFVTIYTQDETIVPFFTSPFYYTGNYFTVAEHMFKESDYSKAEFIFQEHHIT